MKIERITIPGPAGKLESLLEYDANAEAQLTSLVCHPHPLYGGTMHNKVVYRAAKAALSHGFPTLRFNFRGVGESEGTFADSIGEREDVRAALDYLEERFPQPPICVMGFSFGAAVGLAVGATDPRVVALVGLALPTESLDFDFLANLRKPTLIVQGTLDQYSSRRKVESLFAALEGPKRLHWVEGAEHFFAGKLAEVQDVIAAFLGEIAHGSLA